MNTVIKLIATAMTIVLSMPSVRAAESQKYKDAEKAIRKYGGRVDKEYPRDYFGRPGKFRMIYFVNSDLTDSHLLELKGDIETIFNEDTSDEIKRVLDLQFTKVTGQYLSSLKAAKLTGLDLSSTLVRDTGLTQLIELDSVKFVYFDYNYLSFTSLKKFIDSDNDRRDSDRLWGFSLAGATVVDDGTNEGPPKPVGRMRLIKTVQGLKELRELDLSDNEIKDADIWDDAFVVFGKLIWLYLSNNRLTDSSVGAIAKLKTLTSLDLSRNKIKGDLQGGAITDEGVSRLRGLVNLRYLYLSGTGVTNEGLAKLKGLEQLEWLEISDTQTHIGEVLLSKQPLAAAAACVPNGPGRVQSHLLARAVQLAVSKVYQKSLEPVSFRKLTLLYANNTFVSDADLLVIARLPALTTLNVSGTTVTADGLERFMCLLSSLTFPPPPPSVSEIFPFNLYEKKVFRLKFDNVDAKPVTLKRLEAIAQPRLSLSVPGPSDPAGKPLSRP